MEPTALILLGITLVLGFMAFRVASDMGWHWVFGLFLSAVPLTMTFIFGILGLLGSAVFVCGLYKAAAGGN